MSAGSDSRRRSLFRPCIDLHDGQVKQIVGGSLKDEGPGPTTNFVVDKGAGAFAAMYRQDGLTGGHVIKLGKVRKRRRLMHDKPHDRHCSGNHPLGNALCIEPASLPGRRLTDT